jgi:hypothetical protein
MTMDWGALLESLITGIGTVITSFIDALTANADQIAEILIFGAITGAVVTFGSRIFKGLSSAVNGILQ